MELEEKSAAQSDYESSQSTASNEQANSPPSWNQIYEEAQAESLEQAKQIFADIIAENQVEQAIKNRNNFDFRHRFEHISGNDSFNPYYHEVHIKKYCCLQAKEAISMLMHSGFPANYIVKSKWKLESETLYNSEVQYHTKFMQDVKNYIIDNFFIDDSKPKGLVLWGKVGVGKSSALGMIAKMLIKYLDVDIRYATTNDFLNAYSTQNLELLEKTKNSQILFLDAFGQESYNENRTSAMLDLFHHRYSNSSHLVTFVAANIDVRNEQVMSSPIYQQIGSYFKDKNFVETMNFKGNDKRN